MRRVILSFLSILCVCSAQAQVSGHPRILFGPDDIATIHSRAHATGTDAHLLYQEVIQQAEHLLTNDLQSREHWLRGPYYNNVISLCFAGLIDSNAAYLARARTLIFSPGSGFIYDWPDADGQPNRLVWQKIVALGICYDMLYHTLDSSQRVQIRDTIISDLNYSLTYSGTPGPIWYLGPRQWFLSPGVLMWHNYTVLPALALIFGPMAIYGEDPDYSTSLATQDIRLGASHLFLSDSSWMDRFWSGLDGDYPEGVAYSFWSMTDVPEALLALGRWDGLDYFEVPKVKARLSKMADWVAYEVLSEPRSIGDMFSQLNDTEADQRGALGLLLTLSAEYPEKAGVMRWVFDNTIESIQNLLEGTDYISMEGPRGDPLCWIPGIIHYDHVNPVDPSGVLPKSRHFRKAGIVHMRTSDTWADENDVHVAMSASPAYDRFETGVFSLKHQQQDVNHILLSAYGDHHLIDDGSAKSGSNTHSVVLIDDIGQAGSGPWPIGTIGWQRDGDIVQHFSSGRFDFVHGDGTSAHNEIHYGDMTTGGPAGTHRIVRYDNVPSDPHFSTGLFNPVTKAHRYLAFCRESNGIPPYVVIADDICKTDSLTHRFSWNMRTNEGLSNPGFGDLWRLSGSNGNLDMFFHSSSSTLSSESSTSEGVLVHRLKTEAVRNPYFHVVLLPQRTGLANPTFYDGSAIENGSIICVVWEGYVDYSILRYEDGVASGDGQYLSNVSFSTDAKLSNVRIQVNTGTAKSYLMAEGQYLNCSDDTLVTLHGSPGSVSWDGSIVEISGSTITSFRIYAPSAGEVRINGSNVSFVQSGSYVLPNTAPAAESLLMNGDFESGTDSWSFYTNGGGSFVVTSDGGRSHVAQLTIDAPGDNMQFNQTDVALEDGETYRLSFAARSTGGHDLEVYLHKHTADYDGYGLSSSFDIANTWSTYNVEFTAGLPTSTVDDGRLRFWFVGNATSGEQYFFDDVTLTKVVEDGAPTVTTAEAGSITTTSAVLNGTVNPSGSTTSYHFEYGPTPSYGFVTSTESVGSGSSTVAVEAALSSLPPATTYHFRLQATNAVGTTYGDDQSFTTADTSSGGASVLSNGHFASGTEDWSFYSNADGYIEVVSDGERSHVARLTLTEAGTNMQLYQPNLYIEDGETYQLSFAAKSTGGHDLEVVLHKHGPDYDNYGLDTGIDIGSSWGTHTVQFTASVTGSSVNDARLRFWFVGNASDGDQYYFDDVVLTKTSGLGKISVPNKPEVLPTAYAMLPNFPNPFNPSTTIEYQLPASATVRVVVYDVLGREIRTLVSGMREAGYHHVTWDAVSAPSGVYYARFTATDANGRIVNSSTNKMLLMK